MNERLKIFLLFLMCWSVMRIIVFTILTLADYKKYTSSINNFFTALGLYIFGVIAMPFSALWSEWWFFAILTFLYFLFGGGITIFVILCLFGMAIAHLPSIIGFLIVLFCKSKDS